MLVTIQSGTMNTRSRYPQSTAATGHQESLATGLNLVGRSTPSAAPRDSLHESQRDVDGKRASQDKVGHPFRVLKQQFGYVKVRYRGLKKNTAQIVTLFALSNLWMARHKLLAMAQVRQQGA